MSNLLNNAVGGARGTNDPPTDGSPHPASSFSPAQELLRRETEITNDNFDEMRKRWAFIFDAVLAARVDDNRAQYHATQSALMVQIPMMDHLMKQTNDLSLEHQKTTSEMQVAEEWLHNGNGAAALERALRVDHDNKRREEEKKFRESMERKDKEFEASLTTIKAEAVAKKKAAKDDAQEKANLLMEGLVSQKTQLEAQKASSLFTSATLRITEHFLLAPVGQRRLARTNDVTKVQDYLGVHNPLELAVYVENRRRQAAQRVQLLINDPLSCPNTALVHLKKELIELGWTNPQFHLTKEKKSSDIVFKEICKSIGIDVPDDKKFSDFQKEAQAFLLREETDGTSPMTADTLRTSTAEAPVAPAETLGDWSAAGFDELEDQPGDSPPTQEAKAKLRRKREDSIVSCPPSSKKPRYSPLR